MALHIDTSLWPHSVNWSSYGERVDRSKWHPPALQNRLSATSSSPPLQETEFDSGARSPPTLKSAELFPPATGGRRSLPAASPQAPVPRSADPRPAPGPRSPYKGISTTLWWECGGRP